jgi:hypothetical protein
MSPLSDDRPSPPRPAAAASPGGRVIGAVFGIAFFGMGLTIIGFLWGAPFDEFGSPPVVFRIFGSFIALVFVAVGGMVALSALTGRNLLGSSAAPALDAVNPRGGQGTAPDGYQCPHCGAPLSSQADVSPLGDVKCAFCDRWFNIHRVGG